MSRNTFISMIFLMLFSLFGSAAAFAEDPTLHQVYEAAQAGRLNDAQAMMDQVLRDHPGSAKAHFVAAEIHAKQGQMAAASSELKTAEHLAPGLPFAKPQAVESLRNQLAGRASGSALDHLGPAGGAVLPAMAAAPMGGGIPWGSVLLVVGVVVFIVVVARMMSRRNPPAMAGSAYGYGGQAAPGYGMGGMPSGVASGGMGSNILGGLATGAAVGAGMVAGEALVRHFTEDRHGTTDTAPRYTETASDTASPTYDMGGTDFGVSDAGSWDDGSSGGDDWT